MVRAALIKYIKNATNIQFVMPTYRLPTLFLPLSQITSHEIILLDNNRLCLNSILWVVVYVYLGKLP